MTNQKTSKKEQRRQQMVAEKRKRNLMIAVPTILVAVVLTAMIIYRFRPVEGVIDFGTQERNHDLEAEFVSANAPPVGGSHNPAWQNCGIYDAPVDNSLAVHALEHGAIWLTYSADLSQDAIDELQQSLWGESYILMSPYPDQASDIVMSAWGTQLEISDYPDERIEEFIDRYRGGGPEPGASCSGGVGTPINS